MPRHVWGVSRASKAQARSARGAFDPRESKSFSDFSPHPAWLPERTGTHRCSVVADCATRSQPKAANVDTVAQICHLVNSYLGL